MTAGRITLNRIEDSNIRILDSSLFVPDANVSFLLTTMMIDDALAAKTIQPTGSSFAHACPLELYGSAKDCFIYTTYQIQNTNW